MFEYQIPLMSILGLLTVIVLTGLTLDYLRLLRRPVRLGLWLALLGILAGFFFTLKAVLPEGEFYGQVFSEIKTNQKIVALTFDDGPYPPYTGQILDVLREAKIPATFFVLGMNAEKQPELLKRMLAEGHQIGNHTYQHTDLLKVDRRAMEEAVDRSSGIIQSATGQAPRVIRPPHGFRDSVVIEVMRERGLKVVEWSVASRDWTNPGVDTIVQRTVSKVRRGSVILLHDGDGIESRAARDQTVEAARLIIRELTAQGYRFVTVDEILAARTEDGS